MKHLSFMAPIPPCFRKEHLVRIRSRTLTASVLTAALASSGTVAVVQAQDTGAGSDLGSRFTFGVMPDTQFYSRYSTPETGDLFENRYGSEPYAAQAEWLVEYQDELNIPFTAHLGDVVDQSWIEGEWQVASEAMSILENGDMDYSILPGNHDISTEGENPTPFSQYFPADRAAQNATFVERHQAPDQESEYHIFEAEGQEYLVLSLAWRANQETLDWAQQAIDANPDLPVILICRSS